MMKLDRLILAACLLLIILSVPGCGLLVGNIRPVDEKAENYKVIDLGARNSDWIKLEPSQEEQKHASDTATSLTEISDLGFQSKKTASIISLNSACRPTLENQEQDLRGFTQLLLLGISEITLREEKNLTLSGTPALETTVQGKMNNEPVMLRTVVLKKQHCLYDLMFVSRPESFQTHESDFSAFVSSLQLR